MPSLRHPRLDVALPGARTPSRPVLLATMDAPLDSAAARFALETAVECGQPLIIANVVQLPPMPMSVLLRYDQLEYTPEMADSLSAPAELAHSLGVEVERLRVRSPRPIVALLELVNERDAGLLVFGPDPRRMRRRAFRKASKRIREQASCLVWLAEE